jgi:hypothetical protein
MAGISLTNELKVRPLVVIPAFVLLSELRTKSDVLILNSFYMTKETCGVEPMMRCACRGLDALFSRNLSRRDNWCLGSRSHHCHQT